ncbi:MAG: hypothetical protein ABI670_11815 [Chloroflexota bacterium]
MHTNDWSDFTADIAWFVKATDTIVVSDAQPAVPALFKPTEQFKSAFPILTALLGQARITTVNINHNEYHLYGWTDQEGKSLGWLCKAPGFKGIYSASKVLHPLHATLLHCFGGIVERWNELDTWLLHHNTVLTEEECEVGFNGAEDYYQMMCEDEGIAATLNPEDYVAFAFEANGNCTIYHKNDAEILMFAHDHSFAHISPLMGCPEYTLYTINGCPDFSTWVETVASQWRAHILSS